MKLLIVTQKVDTDDENLGFFHRWIKEFAQHVAKVTVIAGSVGNYSLPENVTVLSLGKEKGVGKIRRIWRYWELFSVYYARSDAVFFHMIPEYVVSVLPFLISLKRPTALWYVHKSVTRALRRAERYVDHVFTASGLSFRLPSKKVLYTGHGIDTTVFRPVAVLSQSVSTVRLLSVGRISPVKDLEALIRACAVLKERWGREFTLSIVGGPLMARDEAYLTSLKELVTEKELGNRVFFHGSIPYRDIASVYHDHDIFVSLSTTGSIDKSVLEAMASGMAVITANEAFEQLLPPRYFLEQRSPEFVAERIKTLVDEPQPNLLLSGLVVKNHSLQHTIREIVERLSRKL